ncbi:MAG: hypothetical protein QXJ74_10135 [Nitrososphaera sp.]|uniref:hypothetical protein n=1 Tax=Nitrososphaera sp. TaxID=1971748 RepID=UPI001802C886|nr:hypothetical protein [Nitrososphaera sp.]NWG38232.1 hypothetical protein [Nitrososphaera sp.]
MTSRQDLKDIVDEIRALRSKIDKLENIVEKRFVGEARPDAYEKKAVSEFEKRRKAGRTKFVPLSEIDE